MQTFRKAPMTDKELRDYFYEHVVYEIDMFNATVKMLAKWNLNDLQKNIVLESFVMHLRNLIDFLYPKKVLDDDILGDYYIDDQSFSRKYPCSQTIEHARNRAHKEMNHLTTKRIAGVPPEKNWEVGYLHTEVTKLLVKFFEDASGGKVDKGLSSHLLN